MTAIENLNESTDRLLEAYPFVFELPEFTGLEIIDGQETYCFRTTCEEYRRYTAKFWDDYENLLEAKIHFEFDDLFQA